MLVRTHALEFYSIDVKETLICENVSDTVGITLSRCTLGARQ